MFLCVCLCIPEYISSEDSVELRFWRRLPLDHDGLVCSPAGYDVLWWCAGRLLPQHQSNSHTHTEESERTRETNDFDLIDQAFCNENICAAKEMQGQHLSFHLLSNITVCTVSGLKRILIAVLFPRNLHLLLSGGQTVYKQIIMFVTGDTRDRAATYYRESSASLSSSDEFLLNSGAHLSHPSFSWCIMQSHLIHLLFISAYIVHLFQTKHHCC